MKKLMGNVAVKIAAVFFSFVFALSSFLCVVAAIAAVESDMYVKSKDEIKSSILESKLSQYCGNVVEIYEFHEEIEDFCNENGIYATLEDENGEILYSNYNVQKYIAKYGYLTTYFLSESDELELEADTKQLIKVTVYAGENFKITQRLMLRVKTAGIVYTLRFAVYFIGIISLILFIFTFCFLCASSGRRSDGSILLNRFDKIPFDIVILINFILTFILFDITETNHGYAYYVLLAVSAVILYFSYFSAFLSMVTRIKKKTIIKNNVIYIVLAFIYKRIKKLFSFLWYIIKNLTIVKKTVLGLAAVVAAVFLAGIMGMGFYSSGLFAFLLLIIIALMMIFAVYISICLQKIKMGGELMSQGNFETKIDSEKMLPDFVEFCGYLNNINSTVQNAVDEKTRSERLKTELITNVSHDIKTPLTSIINYVDLIKKENVENEKVTEYISVLDRQSARLKKLIEDLVEASKASTGNLSVELTKCEPAVLLTQTLGEFDEKLKNAGLTPVLTCPENPLYIMADGRHLWRVFENLTANICKYSLSGTRVYLEIYENSDNVCITFKNISKNELNISGEELTERFVRGDSSRNTEGSGLGLSIAKNLTDLQGGKLSIDIDGDLFKATVIFKGIK